MLKVKNISELKTIVGYVFEPTDWITIDQKMINLFAEATGDYQWIHLDEEKAKKESPFGTTIAHGFLTLSLIPQFSIYNVESTKMAINYGTDKVRFTNVVRSGSRVRMNATLSKVEDYGENGVKISTKCVIEIEGEEKPACIAESLALIFE